MLPPAPQNRRCRAPLFLGPAQKETDLIPKLNRMPDAPHKCQGGNADLSLHKLPFAAVQRVAGGMQGGCRLRPGELRFLGRAHVCLEGWESLVSDYWVSGLRRLDEDFPETD